MTTGNLDRQRAGLKASARKFTRPYWNYTERMHRFVSGCVVLAGAFLSPWLAAPVHAQSAANVAVVINDNSPESQRIGEHYARTRSVPVENMLRIRVSAEETIDRGVYLA